MKVIKIFAGSLIISFGFLFVAVLLLSFLQIDAPEGILAYLGIAWIVLAVVLYPWAKKIVRV